MTGTAIAHTERAHATYAPSSASKWMRCGQSIEQAKRRLNSSTAFAQEGTAAHELCELCLRDQEDAETFMDLFIDLRKQGEERFSEDGTPDNFFVWKVDGDMVDGVQLYLDVVREIMAAHPKAILWIEERIDLRQLLGADVWGTGDVVIYDPVSKKMWVIDFKYGRGYAVTARENPQLLVYGSGAWYRLSNEGYVIDEIELVIVQPRASHPEGPVRRYLTDWTEIHTFIAEIQKGLANTGGPAFAGDHCAFCPGTRDCEAFRDWVASESGLALNTATIVDVVLPDISALTMGEIELLYLNADRIEKWVKAIKQMANEAAHQGVTFERIKMVEGRGYRRWKDQDEAERRLAREGVPFEDVHKTKFVAPNSVEKAIGKKRTTKLLGDLIYKPPGNMTLVPIEDPRPDMTPALGHTPINEEDA